MPDLPHSRRLRLARVSEPGRIYLVTTTSWNRAPLFRDTGYARAVSRIAHNEATWRGSVCLAWVLMPDHWHGLVELQEGDLSKIVGRFKSQATKAMNVHRRRQYPVWQKGFHDAGLRKEDDLIVAARYLVANPVRAGLAESVGSYPYWNAVWL